MQDPPEKKSSAENGVEWTSCDGGEIFHQISEGGSDDAAAPSPHVAWARIEEEAKGNGMFVFWLRPGAEGRHVVVAANGTPSDWQMVPVDDGLVLAPAGSDLLP